MSHSNRAHTPSEHGIPLIEDDGLHTPTLVSHGRHAKHVDPVGIPEVPSVDLPSVEVPPVEVPSVDPPSVEAPPVEVPSVDPPSVEAPPEAVVDETAYEERATIARQAPAYSQEAIALRQSYPVERLAYDEVAAVHMERRFYVNDVPSPYLTRRQAQEDIEKTRRRHRVVSTTLVLMLLALMVGCAAWYIWDTLKPEELPEVPTYNTATIERMEFVNSIDATSIVRPIDERAVISEVSGTIIEAFAVEGAYVEEGNVLYTLDNPNVTETYEHAQEALNLAQNDVDRKADALEAAQKALDASRGKSQSSQGTSSSSSTDTDTSTDTSTRSGSNTSTSADDGMQSDANDQTNSIARGATQPVFHLAALTERTDYGYGYGYDDEATTTGTLSDGTSTGTESDTRSRTGTSTGTSSSSSGNPALEARVKSAQQELDTAKQTLENIQQMYDNAKTQFDHLTVRSPISGWLSDLNTAATPSATLIGTERLCTVSDLTSYLVQEEIPADRLGQVHEGEEARLSFPSINDLFVTSYVSSVSANDDGAIHYANVIIENPDERITKNIACNVSIVVQSIPNVIVVPLEAVHTNAEGGTELNMLLDPTRGINAYVHVNVLATNGTQAAIESDSIQVGTSVILPDLETPAPTEEPPAPTEPAPEGQE